MYIFASTAWDFWKRLNETMFTSQKARGYCSGYRKTLFSVDGETAKWGTLDLKFEDIGYKERKRDQLYEFYYPEEGIDKLLEKMQTQGHKICSLALDMVGPKKKEEVVVATKGPCLKTLVFNMARNQTYGVHVFYRTTECTKKFLADLIFLDLVFRRIYPGGTHRGLHVSFHFASIYCHVKQWPLLDILLGDECMRWKWLDEDREEKIASYMAGLNEGRISSYGMVRNGERWYLKRKGIPECTEQDNPISTPSKSAEIKGDSEDFAFPGRYERR